MTEEFKQAGNLYREMNRQPRQRPPDDSTNHVNKKRGYMECEYMKPDGTCKPSEEAVALGLRKAPHLCYMDLPCPINARLSAGLTVVQLFEEHRR